MAINRGIAPPDPTTPVGQMRALLGDLAYTELDPPEPGFGNYRIFGDIELEAFLAAGESQAGAMAIAYLQLAGNAALSAKSVKDFDLSIDNTKTPAELRLLAQFWKDEANALAADVFEMFDVSIDDGCGCYPELAQRPWCGRCNYGVRFF